MAIDKTLYLHEEIMLLALRDKEGTIATGSWYQYAIGGAVLAELMLSRRIAVEESKKKLVDLIDAKPLGDPLLDECLERIKSAKRRASVKTWVSRFSGTKKLRDRVAGKLCQRGILRADEDTVLLLFKRKIFPEVDPRPEKEIIARLKKAIFTSTQDIDPRTVVLFSLAKNADLLKTVFDNKKLKERKKRIEKIVNGDLMGKATKEAVEAAEAAIFVACIVPVVVTSVATS